MYFQKVTIHIRRKLNLQKIIRKVPQNFQFKQPTQTLLIETAEVRHTKRQTTATDNYNKEQKKESFGNLPSVPSTTQVHTDLEIGASGMKPGPK